jgi:hypothetical protein
VFLLEHLRLQKEKKFTGHIPRYLNWKLEFNWRRASIRNELQKMRIQHDISKALKVDGAEKIILDGFIPISFLNTLQDEARLENYVRNTFNLMVEMTPVYWKFGMEPCPLLMGKAHQSRYEC